MMLVKNKDINDKIKKSKDIIKKEKKKIKEEKRKIRLEKINQNKLIPKFFKPKPEEKEVLSLKEQIFYVIFFEIIGAVFCLLILFIISGGRNYIKLYSDLSKLINVYDTIQSNYYGDLNKETLIDEAIKSMVNSVGDDYTTYTIDGQNSAFYQELEGTYEGIGCSVTMNENSQIVVVETFENSPSQKAGLQKDDIIIKIDDQDFSGKTSEDMANYVKENSNSKVKLTILRNGDEQEITVKREKVETPTVTSEIKEVEGKKIGYLDISLFSAVTYEQFKTKLEKLEKDGIEGLVIDVRNDTGGYLSSVTDISSLFLKKGQTIYQLEDDKTKEKVKDETKEYRKYPVAVLINSSSASASEILASAIKESYGGIIVGTNSYGKGTVQKTKTLKDGSMIKYTTQKWLTPEGNWINETGVTPTNVVEVDLESYTKGIDNQLEFALNEIVNKLN